MGLLQKHFSFVLKMKPPLAL